MITVRPGAFKPLESASVNGTVVDKSAEVGALTAGRRYLETIVAEAGDEAITMTHAVLGVSRQYQREARVLRPTDLGRHAGLLDDGHA